MTGPLAQVITLSSFGNDFLFNGKLADNFYVKNASFQFCNKVDFRIFKHPFFSLKSKEVVVAENPAEWFRYLKKDGCKKLRLYFQHSKDQSFAKDYKLAGLIGGGGTWLIEAIYHNYSNGWGSNWEVTKKDDPQNNIWTMKYGMAAKKIPTINLQIDQTQCKNDLDESLTQIEEFAFRHDLQHWGGQFKNAREALHSNNPENGHFYKELIPIENYSVNSRQLLFCAGKAWVFGAMGSWNDLGFGKKEDDDRYEKLTETLYERVNRAIISAVNSY